MLERRAFLRWAFAPWAASWTWAAARKPNIVVIVADDLGYAGISAQGCDDIPTPHIDSIARNGIRFTSGYVSCPVCSPTRAGLMTGRYQQRFGHEFNPGPADQASENFGLPLQEMTLADRLKSLGYATGLVGKWHLGYCPQYHPLRRGFDEFFGFLGGAHSYLPSRQRNPRGNALLRGTEEIEEREYLTDALAREAVSFVERKKNSPYFLYLCFNAVHTPMEAVPEYESRFQNISNSLRRTHAAMLAAMDDAVGRLLAKIRELKQEENTLIFFLSDNGGPTRQTTSKNTPLRGYKAQIFEGGIRVPFLMQWKGHLRAGQVFDKPVTALDIFPTAIAAAGGQAPPVDGVDLLPFLTGKTEGDPHDKLYWRFGPQCAIRKGDWKLLRTADGDWELYNLRKDISETNNLASHEPQRVEELKADWEAWNRQLKPPSWQTQRQVPRKRKKI
ncbi:MAG: sulfatase [Bryobacteraceae bacterium]|nr:sulfatase [Bryobacteraceae bacterium]MDW8379850.1 sulfatase [Bryobacterales bacterium]